MEIYKFKENVVYLTPHLNGIAIVDASTGGLVEVADIVLTEEPVIEFDDNAAWTWTPHDLDETAEDAVRNIIWNYCEMIRAALGGTGDIDQFVEIFMDMEFGDMPLPLRNVLLPIASFYVEVYRQLP